MTAIENEEQSEEHDDLRTLAASERRPAGRWNSVGVPGERSKDLRNVLRRLLNLLTFDRSRVTLVLVTSVVGVVLNVFGPKLLGDGTNLIVGGYIHHRINFHALDRTLIEAGGLYVGSAICTLITAVTVAGIVQRLMYRLRSQVEDKVHAVPLGYIDQGSRGDLLSRVTNDIDNIAQSLQQTLSQMLNSVLLLIGVAVMMFTISPLLAAVALTTVPVSIYAMRVIAKRARPRYINQWRSTGALNGIIEETFTGHAIVKAYGRQQDVEARFSEKNEELFESSFGAQFMSSLMQPVTMFLGNVQYVLVAVVGGLRVASGAISIGDIQAFVQYSRTFSMPLTQLASMMNVFQSGMASLERVFEFLDADEETTDAPPERPPARQGRVTFEHVSFSYRPDVDLIRDLDLVAEPGQTVAIVGPTGAGKTTLVNLLMRFYDVDGGRITVDGRDIRDIPRAELRAQMGMVLQDTWLFGGSIRDNIAYGNPDATEERIAEAAQATYVDRFVHSLPDGYDTLINEEADNVSAGQKQLITIARAFLADPTILILDEATSSVDTRTEVQIQEAMNRLRSDRTSFVIAHRLSTIRGADTILVMENGQIVEQGNHKQLLAAGGAYARLYSYQFGAPVTEVS
ncbi:MAG TPA: ABC transporter ATP-binding protein [Acidimicrobiales bacterium]|jgi:ATP-binding cassette subfamily B protein|nr:ABC transporter ATP-binding protein [Acidimicrobiales bacterium]